MVKYLDYIFEVEKVIQLNASSGIYLHLRPIKGIVYNKRILRLALKYPISTACVELLGERAENKELENAK